MKKRFSSYITGVSAVYGALLLTPLITFAQFAGKSDISDFLKNIILFINGRLIPLVFAVALLLFFYGVYMYFIQGADNDDNRKNGRTYILYAIIAFVVMVSVFGIANLIASGLGFDDPDKINDILPDGIPTR